ncbi:MAG: carotenoid biosynthesis protein [Bacteroidales bacterium]|nr:carotenoid biosynthesis protein [Bacteroidales bacterium]
MNKKQTNKNFLNFTDEQTKKFFIIFYIIGTLGFLIPYTYNLFVKLIPIALLVNFIILFSFHKHKMNFKSIFVLFTVFVLGLFVEIIGVKTKIIFGNYYYGNSLGVKLFEVPLMIGVNWVFMVYTSTSILEKYKFNVFFKILISSIIMVLYDVVLELVAPNLDMWYWTTKYAPVKNFVAWFILAIFFNSLIKIFKIKTSNKLSFILLFCQFLFFSILSLIFIIK